MEQEKQIFDVAVIGGGPAGMIAAGRAGECGAKVILLEKNKKVGVKLLLTGKGRCNIANAEFDIKKLAEQYKEGRSFLLSVFSHFGIKETLAFFEKRKLKMKTERGQRVFPRSDRAEDVLKTLLRYLRENNVIIAKNANVHRLSVKNNEIKKIVLANKKIIYAKNVIVATGGVSYSFTGSTGDGIRWANSLDIKTKKLSPSLVPIRIKEEWIKNLQGLSLKNVNITVKQGDKSIKRFGECLFTHFGLSGPIILDLSKQIGDMLLKGEVKISIDLKPALTFQKLNERVVRDFKKYNNKMLKNALSDLLPQKLIPEIINISKIDSDKKVNNITKEERKNLVRIIKNIELSIKSLMGFDMAIITSGGVALKEINQKTMQSKKIDNLFFAGEVLDADGPTGGFNLQLCWSTGYIAGENAAKNMKNEKT